MIAGIRTRHDRGRGKTPSELAYSANDPELLRWVQATAAYGFIEAYRAYVRPLPTPDRDRYYAEGLPASRLYGAEGIPASEADLLRLFEGMHDRLRPSETVFE